jgi:N-acetylglutamate synthase-like GNAT family acetyltransferase
MKYKTSNKNLTIRTANKKDVPIILDFIKKLAKYEKLLHKVKANKKKIEKSIFERKEAEVLIAEFNNIPVGFALFFKTYSTFLGQANMHLEDIFVDEEMRKQGIGKELFKVLSKIALERKYQRFEWNCLTWNKPSLKFYKKLGAITLNDWLIHRLGPDEMKNLITKK